MIKHFTLLAHGISLTLYCQTLFAQQNTIACGGKATGSGGSVSYSIGHLDYLSSTGSGGFLNQGLQHPFEIFDVTEVAVSEANPDIRLYPNPACDVVLLEAGSAERYILTDGLGRVILASEVTKAQTMIPIRSLPAGLYFLRVKTGVHNLKTFKINKN